MTAAARPLPAGARFETDVPQRLDRLPWSRWHLRVVVALGITWMLDGLEVTLVGAIAPLLGDPRALGLTEGQIGVAASAYLFGAISGALVFGRLTDMFGRKRLFLITLGLYLASTAASALSWSFTSFAVFRCLTGAGIGGEYSAVNSAIDELLPARVRGRADLIINSTYWLGTALGAAMTVLVLGSLPPAFAWRVVFGVGTVLGLTVLFIRHHVPESPRWLLLHGRVADAERVMSGIEKDVERSRSLPAPARARTLEAKGTVTFKAIARVLLRHHLRRTVLGLSLMVAQAFAYNGVFFTYALVLTRFYGVSADRIGLYLLPFAAGNLAGPIALGHLFDTVGRRAMIASTYIVSGLLMVVAGLGLARGWFDATTQTLVWCAVFFVASAAASSAYLTVSELFPVELRGMAIALFYAAGTAAGGLVAPALFGVLVQTGSPARVFTGYLIGAALMVGAGIVAATLGVPAEQKSLEKISEL
jgi:MFS family permease